MWKVPRCLSIKLGAGYTGWMGHVSQESVQSSRAKTRQPCALWWPPGVCDTMAASSWGQRSPQEGPMAKLSEQCLTTKPVLCDFTQLDNLQAAVLQFEIVATFEEVTVICETQGQELHVKKYSQHSFIPLPVVSNKFLSWKIRKTTIHKQNKIQIV